MWNALVERKLSQYLSVGSFFVTVFILNGINNDPVNVTKQFALGAIAFSLLAITMVFGWRYIQSNFKLMFVAVLVFDLLLLVSTFTSKAPFAQNFYGTYGRNNGALAYLALSFILLSALLMRDRNSFNRINTGFLFAGAINAIYCGWVLAFGDFMAWNNPYGKILGLFGNPDFISAFLGMFIAASAVYVMDNNSDIRLRIFLGAMIPLSLYEIVRSHAIQGLVVTAGGLTIVGFYFLRSRSNKNLYTLIYSSVVAIVGFLAVLGTFQKGPLSFVYKRSVSFRGSYWNAAIEMGNSHPMTGIGLDAYGDWYRSARPDVALIDTPGIKTLSNVAHNVVLDFFASGGYPLLISYLILLAFGVTAIVRVTLRTRNFDRVFITLVVVWLGYQVQSIISINQIGLAVWGWLITGLLVAYERSSRHQEPESKSNQDKMSISTKKTASTGILSPQFVAGIGLAVGVFVAVPPLSADITWFNAMNSRDALQVEKSLTPSYFNPSDSLKFANAANLFHTSKLDDLAHKYALLGVNFNPNYFDAWKILYSLTNSSPLERELSLANMKRLDPKNPDVTAN
jgi:O-antigen ligase